MKSILAGANNHFTGDLGNVDLLSHKTGVTEPHTLHTLIDSIPALVAYIDCNMVLQYCNQPFRTWFSIKEDVAGRSFPTIAGEEMFFQLQRHMGKVLVGERAHFQISVNTGHAVHYLDATLSPDFDDRKRVKGFIFHSSDITEKNRTERALKDYFENASIGLHWVNSEGIIIWANPAELNMLGYATHEYVGHHISEFHSDKQLIDDILNKLLNRSAIRNQEAELVCKDGSIRHVTLNSSALWEGNKFIHTRCFTVDTTEQKRAAQAVKESEERFKTMANLVPLIIWTTDADGYFDFLNVRWQLVTGKTIEEGLHENWINFIHPEDREKVFKSWKRSFSARKNFEARFRFLNAQGDYNTSYVNSIPRYNTSGDFIGYIGIMQDVSSDELIKSSLEKIVLDRTDDLRKRNAELKKAEEKLQEKNKELEEINEQLSSFAHIASHDLQEPLRKIQTFSSRLFESDGDKFSEKGNEFYRRIIDSSSRMKNLVQDLLAYSKSNGSEDKTEDVDLNILFKEVVNELEVKISEKGAIVKNLGLPQLEVIRFQFHQLFLNLLSNAIKFAKREEAPEVVVQSELLAGKAIIHEGGDPDKTYHHIIISDNGIGFEPDQEERIFDMFHRLHSRTKYEGTGIGLAICRKIVENHKGFIRAESRLNEGAIFHIYLPA
ncbi:MAG TPA: PAS domain S-box protein [Chryseosolibacter sp.]|nr:PAS domain S-box protein [Chryseosolibacter sp.]